MLAAALFGCGGERTDRATTSGTTRTVAQAAQSDRARAHGALLRLADLPAGWRDVATDAPDLRCAGDPLHAAAAVQSTGRLIKETWGVQEIVALFRSDAEGRSAYARLNSPRGLACLRRSARRQVSREADGPASPLELERVEPLEAWGKAFRYTSTVERGYGPMRSYIDAVHARVGRSVAALVLVAGLEPVDETLYDDVIERMRERLRGALG